MPLAIFAPKRELQKIRFNSIDEYKAVGYGLQRPPAIQKFIDGLLTSHASTYGGFCVLCNCKVNFQIGEITPGGKEPNWRDSLYCDRCQVMNRARMSFHIMSDLLKGVPKPKVYTSEQITTGFAAYRKHWPDLVGSEYFGADAVPGSINQKGVRNEDLTKLSFAPDSFDAVLSLDCLEHMPEHMPALREIYRVLKPKGKMLITVPFARDWQHHVLRASIDEKGEIVHHLPPDYHEDPVDPNGCLCFRYFGWDLLDEFKEVGFKEAYAVCYESIPYGYLGWRELQFIGIK